MILIIYLMAFAFAVFLLKTTIKLFTKKPAVSRKQLYNANNGAYTKAKNVTDSALPPGPYFSNKK